MAFGDRRKPLTRKTPLRNTGGLPRGKGLQRSPFPQTRRKVADTASEDAACTEPCPAEQSEARRPAMLLPNGPASAPRRRGRGATPVPAVEEPRPPASRERICTECGAAFTARSPRDPQLRCSRACGQKSQARKMIERAARMSSREGPVTPSEVFVTMGLPEVSRQQLAAAGSKPLREQRGISLPDPELRFVAGLALGPTPEGRPDLGPCLIFTGAVNKARSGGGEYCQFHYNGRNGYAHRYAWERERGPIPNDLTIDHLCRVQRCVRLSHLELVDGVTNYLRGVDARDTCINGHPLTADNIRTPRGKKQKRRSDGKDAIHCLICHRETVARGALKRNRSANGLPDRRIKYDQALVREQIALIRSGEQRIVTAARLIGCHPNYLGRRAWEETKTAVFARDECCTRCGRGDGLDAHHRRPRRQGGTSDPKTSFGMANLVALCRRCHDYIEVNRFEAERLGFLIRGSQQQPEDVPVLRHGVEWLIPGEDGWIVPESPPEIVVDKPA